MATRYPIILVHGIIIKDTLWLTSFGEIDNNFQSQGHKVYRSKVYGFESTLKQCFRP